MNRGRNLLFILCVVVAISSVASHVAVRWLGIYSTYGIPQPYGPKDEKAVAILHGSSLAYDGIDWDRISKLVGGSIESWATAGSSPAEWEMQNRRAPRVPESFVVVSAYDLNEYWLCDFRADIVPFTQTIRDLHTTGANWPFSKRVLSQYAVMLARKVFPTIGRSDGVMTGIRDMLGGVLYGRASGESNEGPKLGIETGPRVEEKVTDWSPARIQRRLVLMRQSCQDRCSFDGLKKIALIRLLQRAATQGDITLIVMPVSPIYQKEFLIPEVKNDFEKALADIEQHCPEAKIIRLDQITALDDNNMFRDFVHLNNEGQHIATTALVTQLDKQLSQR